MRKLITRAHCSAFSAWLMDRNPLGHPVEVLRYYRYWLLERLDLRFGEASIGIRAS